MCFAIFRSISHITHSLKTVTQQLCVGARSLSAFRHDSDTQNKSTRTHGLAAWHTRSLSLLVDVRALPHVLTRVLGLRRGHSLALGDSSDVSRRHSKAAELQAFSCAGIPLIRLWYVDACAGKQRCQTLEFFPCALLN